MDLLTTLYTWVGNISNYSATANLHNSQTTTAHPKPFAACCVFTSRSLSTASNSWDSSASCAQFLSSYTPVQNWLGRPSFLPYSSSSRISYKHPVSNSTCIVARRFCAARKCLPSRCLETALVYPRISRSSYSKGSTRYTVLLYKLPCFVFCL
jgi:hypothetical protein